jgi:hypothetical protein
VVCAKTAYTIGCSGVGNIIKVSGGFVFGYGTEIVQTSNLTEPAKYVINGFSNDVTIGGDAVVCAWNQAAGHTAYTADASNDLISTPSGAVKWGKSGAQSGINYTNGANSGFFPIDGVTVTVSSTLSSMSNFVKVNTYTYGQFIVVDENAWYGKNQQGVVALAYEYGLMKGTSPTKFNPAGNMTLAEAITIAARVHVIYRTAEYDYFVQGSPWYQVYVDYALDTGIIGYGEFTDYNRPATRAEMARIFARSLTPAEFPSQNTVNALPDVNTSTPHHDDIFMLYKAGVLTGSNAQGKFNPSSNIMRAEAAAIISRVILPITRQSGYTYG